MSKDFKMWIYHPQKDAKIIDSKNFNACEKQGWRDSPAKFKEKKAK